MTAYCTHKLDGTPQHRCLCIHPSIYHTEPHQCACGHTWRTAWQEIV